MLVLVLVLSIDLVVHIVVVIPLEGVSLVLGRLLVLSLQMLTKRIHVLWEVVMLEWSKSSKSVYLWYLAAFLRFSMNVLIRCYYVNGDVLIVTDLIIHWN